MMDLVRHGVANNDGADNEQTGDWTWRLAERFGERRRGEDAQRADHVALARTALALPMRLAPSSRSREAWAHAFRCPTSLQRSTMLPLGGR